MSCVYNRNTKKWDVKFNTGKTYSYAYLNVEKLTEPDVLNPNMYRISRDGREFFDIKAIYVFRSTYESYWRIRFGDGKVTIVGIYRGCFKRKELNKKLSRFLKNQDETVEDVGIESDEENIVKKSLDDNIHYIDVISIVQDISF